MVSQSRKEFVRDFTFSHLLLSHVRQLFIKSAVIICVLASYDSKISLELFVKGKVVFEQIWKQFITVTDTSE